MGTVPTNTIEEDRDRGSNEDRSPKSDHGRTKMIRRETVAELGPLFYNKRRVSQVRRCTSSGNQRSISAEIGSATTGSQRVSTGGGRVSTGSTFSSGSRRLPWEARGVSTNTNTTTSTLMARFGRRNSP